ncbi:MAG: iron-sulfur cluster assembly scaffold protein [Clostridia bacterium]|nr:iron-sulfur cluster assembly scaffold protein [Clostridia bacterium]
MYNEKILNIFKSPRNAGGLQGASAIGKFESESDVIKLYIKTNEEGVVTEAKFKSFGNVITIVCSSIVTELVEGKQIDELLEFDNQEIISLLGEIPEEKIYVLDIVQQTLTSAVQDYYKRKEKEEKNK